MAESILTYFPPFPMKLIFIKSRIENFNTEFNLLLRFLIIRFRYFRLKIKISIVISQTN